MADTNKKYNFLNYEGLSLFWSNVKNVIETNKEETNTTLTNLDTRVDNIEDALANQIISITYTDLKTLRDSSQLVPGQQYRITDYQCTTTQQYTRSADHVFDIIVTADDESTLNEVARAIQHDGDTYFANNDLNTWKIWYCLDNDTNRFAWTDGTNGKGVIYRMIDEFNNDVPYDFKNIQFYRQWDSHKSLWSIISSIGVPCYTFSSKGSSSTTSFTDMSLSASNAVYSNVIKEYITSNKQNLNNICFFGPFCYNNSFGNDCGSNSFGNACYSNSFGNNCRFNSFGNDCGSNSFGNACYSNSFGNSCSYNSFGKSCYNNTLGKGCSFNSFGNVCYFNTFGHNCTSNSFGYACNHNTFGNNCYSNSFGNNCYCNSFRNGASTGSTLKDYIYYNHFDDGCSYNVIWNSDTTSSSVLLKNINVNRGVVGTDSSYNMINIDVLNSEQEINVNQVDGIVSISNISDIISNISNKLDKIIELSYDELVTLRDDAQLIPGQQYRIIDYITTTSQENTKSAGHQFDIIVTADSESILNEEARAIQHDGDEYFINNDLNAWKIWYCLDNDTNRFAWAGDVPVCTINPELIDGNAFITPFNFESCVWVDGNNDGEAGYGENNHDMYELIYEWGYFTDENGVKQLCIYKSDADLYVEEGHPDYGDKYLYRGVINVDGAEYDYWQKWDERYDGSGSVNVGDLGDYVYATTQRIVSNPEAYSVTEGYVPGKGVIYRMIDEWNNDVPYDFKNIQFTRDWSTIAPDSGLTGTVDCYTFSVFLNGFSEGATADDESIKAKECIEIDEEGNFGNNVIKLRLSLEICSLNDIVFYTDWNNSCVYHYGNTFGSDCFNNSFGSNCYNNSFGSDCSSNTFGSDCTDNTFGSECYNNTFGPNCYSNSFGNGCSNNTFGSYCYSNSFGSDCYHNSFGSSCFKNTFGSDCYNNTFGSDCYHNSFGSSCYYITFASDKGAATKYNYYQNNHFGDGCQYILFKGVETASASAQVQNYNFAQGLQGTLSAYLTIDGKRNRSYETYISRDTDGTIKESVIADKLDKIIETTYAKLVSLRNSSGLVPGQQYRITDYQCTTTQENTRSAGHPFDIIVTADDASIINEVARAVKHDGDDYFANSDLNAWQIWYCLDNDTTRFNWADGTNGKGVIYRMIDEWGNDVPYDFKNIQFKRYILDATNAIATDVVKDGELNAVKAKLKVMSHRVHTSLWYYGSYVSDVYPAADENTKYVPFGDILYNGNGPSVLCPINEENFGWFYTFSNTDTFNDITVTIQENVYNNVIKSNKFLLVISPEEGRYLFEEQKGICLNDIIFIGNDCVSNSFGNNCVSNSFGNSCGSNSFGNDCVSNSFGNDCSFNSFGNNCGSNSFGNACYSNSFGNSCSYNSFGNACYSNSFGNSCSYNSFGNDCVSNSFGNSCGSNSFGNDCVSNSFGNDCSFNSFGNNCGSNSFGNACYSNSFGYDCSDNTFGNSCGVNSLGNNCQNNSFANNCFYIKFATDSTASTTYNYYRNNHFGDGCQYILFKGVETASASAQVQNYNFAQGLQGPSNTYLTIDGVRNLSYEVKVAKNSNGELKIYCEADLIR